MDLYLSKGYDFQNDILIEDYESIIWTDRFAAHGDFELKFKSIPELLYPGTDMFLLTDESARVMMIENIEESVDADESPLLVATGRSLEAFMYNRNNTTAQEGNGDIRLERSIPQMIEYMVDRYLINVTPAVDAFPGLGMGYVPPAPQTDRYIKRDLMYNVIKNLADEGDYGFAIYLNRGGDPTTKLTFHILEGLDKTDPNNSIYREYSEDAGTLSNATYFHSVANFKTHARVQGKRRVVDVYAPGYSENSPGFQRRTLVVDAHDIPQNLEDPTAWDVPPLVQRGKDALAEVNNQKRFLVSGEVLEQRWNDIYYGLGDKVWIKDRHGTRSMMRITEDIHSQDRNGYTRIPGFSEVE